MCGPIVVWSFVGTGLYAWRARPESRVGALMVLLGFAWCVAGLSFANSRFLYSFALVFGGLWGGVFLQLIMSFPTGRLAAGRDRAIVLAGYLLFTVGSVPALLFADAKDLGCDDCAANLLQVRHDEDLASAFIGVQAALYVVLFVIVLVVLALRWRRAEALDRLQRTPVYVCGARHVPARDGRDRGRGTGGLVGGVRGDGAAALRVPGRAAAQPRRAARRRADDAPRRAARLAGTARRRR